MSTVELRTAIGVAIQSLIEFLENQPDSVSPATISVLTGLAEHGASLLIIVVP
jgi:hypothetical protein